MTRNYFYPICVQRIQGQSNTAVSRSELTTNYYTVCALIKIGPTYNHCLNFSPSLIACNEMRGHIAIPLLKPIVCTCNSHCYMSIVK